eukprot:TRINITY_DN1299_c0_g1_i1.p1 TRINITY_DN1299_c0_g1~~TRINITY_DN1299_c0_g1_i1.p1  ORF type:complete len:437 (+),score=45.01 TRINITY_DN1299_c0_g1_i1:206-1516(+)
MAAIQDDLQSRTLFCGDLEHWMDESTIEGIFLELGYPVNAEIRWKQQLKSKQHLVAASTAMTNGGFAKVRFASAEQASTALSTLRLQPMPRSRIEGKVFYLTRLLSSKLDSVSSVSILDLPENTQEIEIVEFFKTELSSLYKDLAHCKVVNIIDAKNPDAPPRPSTSGFVRFTNERARDAFLQRDGSPGWKPGHILRVASAHPSRLQRKRNVSHKGLAARPRPFSWEYQQSHPRSAPIRPKGSPAIMAAGNSHAVHYHPQQGYQMPPQPRPPSHYHQQGQPMHPAPQGAQTNAGMPLALQSYRMPGGQQPPRSMLSYINSPHGLHHPHSAMMGHMFYTPLYMTSMQMPYLPVAPAAQPHQQNDPRPFSYPQASAEQPTCKAESDDVDDEALVCAMHGASLDQSEPPYDEAHARDQQDSVGHGDGIDDPSNPSKSSS